ncbi:UNVERIFIED_ORG: hypothetical protein L601_000100000210 [Gordonia westfalica J30]
MRWEDWVRPTEACSTARAALEAFFDTYNTPGAVGIDLPDHPTPRDLDLYELPLRYVDIVDGDLLFANLGGTLRFYLRPTLVEISEDLSSLTIHGRDMHFKDSTFHHAYLPGWIEFKVWLGMDFVLELRDTRGARLRQLQQQLSTAD